MFNGEMKNPLSIEEKRKKNNERAAKWREANREKVNRQSLDWVNRQIEKDPNGFRKIKCDRSKEYRKNNLESCKERSKNYTRKLRDTNREEYNRSQREYRKNNPEKFRKYYETRRDKPSHHAAVRRSRMKKYGITVDEYDKLFLQQDGKCAMCGKPSEKTLVVDHDHETKNVRSLLCERCNIMFGWIEDGWRRNPEILSCAAQYREKHIKH